MPIDFRNTNTLWASAAVETLARLGLQTAVVCPGSRSTPLTLALAQHPAIEAIPILDERSASFFALGAAKQQCRPVALVCTSGTAGANFYPAVIEAYESAVPLLIFTADRPHELRACASGQTIDQHRLYGSFVKQYSELSVPAVSNSLLAYLRQTLISAWRRAVSPLPGPIHFNCPFRDPLPPTADAEMSAQMQSFSATFDPKQFFSAVVPPPQAFEQTLPPVEIWQRCASGLIVAGPAEPHDPAGYVRAIAQLSHALGWPILAEGLSPLRNYCHENNGDENNYYENSGALVSAYDAILRNEQRAESLIPEAVLQLGPLPTSKVLRQWLQRVDPPRWVVGSQRNLDPLHGTTRFLTTSVERLVQQVVSVCANDETLLSNSPTDFSTDRCAHYRQRWMQWEKIGRSRLNQALEAETALAESKVVWLLSQHLPKDTPLFVANSMPVRDVEYFWPLGDRHILPYFSRGANGIDGTLSTAMGLAHRYRPTVLLTGDLAFLHDTNGLLTLQHFFGHLTIVMINNSGGGIFEMLPIAQFEPEFERYFATPQRVNFAALCETYGMAYCRIEDPDTLARCVEQLPQSGMRLLEVVCDRKQSVRQRKSLLADGRCEWPI